MKKILTLAAAIVLTTSAFAQSSWRLGVTAGTFGNHARFNGGMQNANALFTPNNFHTGALGLVARKTINNHLSFQTGFNFGSLGFEYSMARNYNLTKPMDHYMVNRVRLGTVTIPATLIWNFRPNCKNVRWFVGGGFSLVGHDDKNTDKNVNADEADQAALGLNGSDYIHQTVSSSSFVVVNGHLMGGLEKITKKNTMWSLALWVNRGFTPVAYSDVTYSVNGTVYNHSFKNYNNYAGLTLTYYFKNFKGGAQPKAVAAK